MMVASTRLAHRVVASVLLATGSVLAGEPTGDAAAQGHAGDVSRVAGVFCASAATNLYGSTGAARGIRTPDPIITNWCRGSHSARDGGARHPGHTGKQK